MYKIWIFWREPQIRRDSRVSERYRGHPLCYPVKNLHMGHDRNKLLWQECGQASSQRHMLKKQYVEVMGKGRFSAWVTQTDRAQGVTAASPAPGLLSQPQPIASDGQPAGRKCLDVYLASTSHKAKISLAKGPLAMMQHKFVVPPNHPEYPDPALQSCPDNLLLYRPPQGTAVLATKVSLRLNPSEMLSCEAQPALPCCSEPSSSQRVPHLSVPQAALHSLPGMEHISCSFSQYLYGFSLTFFFFQNSCCVSEGSCQLIRGQ